jgi:transcriptional regulator with XRE-family HTH domain
MWDMNEQTEQSTHTDGQEFLRRLGQRIKELRRARNLSQEQLAEAAELVQHYVSQIEQGERNVSIVTLRLLAQALGVTLSALVEGLG